MGQVRANALTKPKEAVMCGIEITAHGLGAKIKKFDAMPDKEGK